MVVGSSAQSTVDWDIEKVRVPSSTFRQTESVRKEETSKHGDDPSSKVDHIDCLEVTKSH